MNEPMPPAVRRDPCAAQANPDFLIEIDAVAIIPMP
jgi:hypothetical protein